MPVRGYRYRNRRRWSRFARTTRRYFKRNPKKKTGLAWRRHLLSDTHANTHYRSIFGRGFVVSAATLGSTTNLGYQKILALPTTPTFWTTAGGGQTVDTGNALPGFGRNIIIRGGRISIIVALRSTAVETIKLTVYLLFRKPCSEDAILPAMGDRSFLWDPSIEPDFTRYGRILWKKQAILEPTTGSSSVQMFHRLQPQKIDHENFEQNGSRLEWVVCVQKLTAVVPATSPSVDVQIGHSLSFSGDEIS